MPSAWHIADAKKTRQPRLYDNVMLPKWNWCVYPVQTEGLPVMHLDIIMIQPLIALIFGILILLLPRILNYLVAIYLILVGIVGLFPHIFDRLFH
jgi:hypothetical protein